MKLSLKTTFRRALALGGLSLGIAALSSACTAQQESPPDENTGEGQQGIGGCCAFGDYICPKDGANFEYTQCPGGPSQLNAYNACKTHCGGTTCTNSPPEC
jgi:hypothetical protein